MTPALFVLLVLSCGSVGVGVDVGVGEMPCDCVAEGVPDIVDVCDGDCVLEVVGDAELVGAFVGDEVGVPVGVCVGVSVCVGD
jgi:hypothetical protein